VGQGNVNILQNLHQIASLATNLHQLTLHSTTSCPTTWKSYRYHRLLWRHFALRIAFWNRQWTNLKRRADRQTDTCATNLTDVYLQAAVQWYRADIFIVAWRATLQLSVPSPAALLRQPKLHCSAVTFSILSVLNSACQRFYPRDATQALTARYLLSSCVRLSAVRLSHAAIVSKRLNVRSCKQHRVIAHGL